LDTDRRVFHSGIRNLIGLTSGMMKLRLRQFMPYAYCGAVISSVTTVSAGYFLGMQATWVLASMNVLFSLRARGRLLPHSALASSAVL